MKTSENLQTKLMKLYKLTADYAAGKEISPMDILSKASDIYVKHKDELPEKVIQPLAVCLPFINHDYERDMTVAEVMSYGDELIEDLSGYLGEYFCD